PEIAVRLAPPHTSEVGLICDAGNRNLLSIRCNKFASTVRRRRPLDIELARTFLAIVAAGNFVRAAERLHLSQTAVSARVKSLEEQLRRPLFVRNKAGAVLTPAGEQFLRHAPRLVQLWERARHQVAVPPGL